MSHTADKRARLVKGAEVARDAAAATPGEGETSRTLMGILDALTAIAIELSIARLDRDLREGR